MRDRSIGPNNRVNVGTGIMNLDGVGSVGSHRATIAVRDAGTRKKVRKVGEEG